MPTDDDMDAPAPATCTFAADELDVPSNVFAFSEDSAAIGCSRPVWEGTDSDRCVWHAEQGEKPPELSDTVPVGRYLSIYFYIFEIIIQ